MKKILSFLVPLFFVACQDDDSLSLVHPSSSFTYSYKNMLYPSALSAGTLDRVTIQLENGAVVKRIGGLRSIDEGSGYAYLFDTSLYDDILYSGNRITVEAGKLLNYSTFPSETTVFLIGSQNHITHKISVHPDGFQVSADTLKYQYNAHGLLIGSTRKTNSYLREAAVYYYNSANNLDRIVTQSFYFNDVQRTTIERFSNYDSAPNPLKKLFIFDETFLRSLSTNNFMKYERSYYNFNNELEGTEERIWNIPHNSNGNIIF